MTTENPSIPQDRTLRQTIEGMPMMFCPAAAGDLRAVIQIKVTGAEAGSYYLQIASGDCFFRKGPASNPSLTINTPSGVWLQVSSGQISGQDALLKGLYTVEGDTALLLRMGDLFTPPENFSVIDTTEPPTGQLFPMFRRNAAGQKESPAGYRPAGPLALSGMGWMTLLFIPWTVFWILFDIRSINTWFSAGVPFILMSLILLYRLVYNRPTWQETASWAFFLAACLLSPVAQLQYFLTWGSIIGSLLMGFMWLISLSHLTRLPFCAEYSKWGFINKLWRNSMFIQPNMAISLAWGWEFIIAGMFGVAARFVPAMFIPFTIIRYGLMLPAAIFTTCYQKGVMDRHFKDIDRTMSTLRTWAYIGCGIIAAMLISLWFIPA
jgi:hypothetical protein